MTGKIKFTRQGTGKGHGFGFIIPDDGGPDIFFHVSRCNAPFPQLYSGQKVSYTIESYKDRPIAVEVTAV